MRSSIGTATMTDQTMLLDVNVLLALFDPRHAHHEAAHRWFTTVGSFATTPLTETAFVRLMSNPKVGGETVATALEGLRSIRAMSGHRFVPDQTSLADTRVDLTALVGYRQVTDFHLINLAATHECRFATFDAKVTRSLTEADRHHAVLVPV